VYPPLTDHARRELHLAGHIRRHPAHAALLLALVAGFDTADHPEGGHTAAGMLHTLLTHGTLTPLTADPAEWADKTDRAEGRLWRSRRNRHAFSRDAGQTYELLTDPTDPDGSRPRHVSALARTEGVADL
jgi:hypothetical protein